MKPGRLPSEIEAVREDFEGAMAVVGVALVRLNDVDAVLVNSTPSPTSAFVKAEISSIGCLLRKSQQCITSGLDAMIKAAQNG
jgi:hypothetical protein